MIHNQSSSWLILRAVVDRMIPADDFPSGWDAGVGEFLSRIFATDLADKWPAIDRMLSLINNAARQEHTREFIQLTSGQQDDILSRIELGTLHRETGPTAPHRVISLLADLCAEGYYGDPGNGGNRDMIAWRMIGYLPGAGGDRWSGGGMGTRLQNDSK